MNKFFTLLLGLFLTLSVSAQQKLIIRLENPDAATAKYFITRQYDIASYRPGEYLDLVVDDPEFQHLKSEGYQFRVYQNEDEIRQNLSFTEAIPGYRTYAQVLAELQLIESTYPEICKLYDIGDSRGKQYFNAGKNNYMNYQHDIWALKVSSNVNLDEDKPAIFYMGAHHAREPLSTEVTMYILNHILQQYGTDPDITNSVNTKEIWFVPIVNPDGHKIVLDQIDLTWRKNIRDNDNNGQITLSPNFNNYPDGVDPNRNYGWQWGGEGSSSSMNSLTYRGPAAFSEPEVQAMRDLMADRHFVAGITYHTYSELVLWPYGYTSNATAPDAAALSALGVQMAQTIPRLGSGYYTPQPSWALYPAAGVTDDYAYGKHGIFCYTIELATQFIPPSSQVVQVCQGNLQAALILLNRVDRSTLTGTVTDAVSGDPVVADVYVNGIDNTGLYREPYRSNAQFGRYFRMLSNGSYNVTFSAFGYLPQTLDNVNIAGTGQTLLNVALNPAQTVNISGTVYNMDSGLPIQGAMVEILDIPLDPEYTDENGNFSFQGIFEGVYTVRIFSDGYLTLLQEISVTVSINTFNFQLVETFAESFESGSFGDGWTFFGNQPWTIDNATAWHGSSSAKSGSITHSEATSMIYTQETGYDSEISFYIRVSSEQGYDYLRFYLNDVQKGQWSGTVNWTEIVVPVQAGYNMFRWTYSKDGSVSTGQDCAWVDFITFPPAALCSPPLNLVAGSLTPSSALLSWIAGADETSWDLIWGDAGFDPESEGVLVSDLETTTYLLSGLDIYTAYDFNVRAHCEGEQVSDWRGPVWFKTLCLPKALPFSENFNAVPDLPPCWEIIDHVGAGEVWQIGTHEEGIEGTTGYYAFLNSDEFGIGNVQNSDLVSPLFDFTGYQDVTIAFNHYFRQYPGTSGTLYYQIGLTDNWVEIAQWTTTTANPDPFSQVIPELENGPFVRFKWNYTGSYGWYWDVDDILVTANPIPPIVPETRFVDDLFLGDNDEACFDATQTLYVSNLLVEYGGVLSLIAGEQIFLLDGTVVEEGGYLSAVITENETYCTSARNMLWVVEDAIAQNLPVFEPAENDLKLYPNPTSGRFVVECKSESDINSYEVQVYSMMGELVYQTQAGTARYSEHDLGFCPPGIYLLRLISGNKIYSMRLIKN